MTEFWDLLGSLNHSEIIVWEVEVAELPKLPKGYGFKGGAARLALLRALGLEELSVRDFDVVRIDAFSDGSIADEIVIEFMADNFAHGWGVEAISDV